MNALSSWSPGDYKRAGEKHYKTCMQLLSDVDKKTLERPSQITSQAVLFDLYYLGGYVIECCLKYYILTDRQHKRIHEKLTKLDLELLHLKDHSIEKLSTIALSNGGIDINFKQKGALFKNWSEQIRYGLDSPPKTELDQTEITKYFQEIKTIKTQLLHNKSNKKGKK